MNEKEQKLKEIEGNIEYINENNQNNITKSIEDKPIDADKVLKA
jgi:hypothetical protein